MENLILWGFPILGGLAGFSSKLFKSYVTLLNIGFAIYLALWSEGLVSGLFRLPGAAGPYKSAITLAACAIIVGFLLRKLTDQLAPNERDFDLPPLFNKFGGALCGFLAGMALINFAAFVFCTIPQKTAASGIVSIPAVEKTSVRNLISLSNLLDGLSFQAPSRIQRMAKLDMLLRAADPKPPEKKSPAPVKGQEKKSTESKAAPAAPANTAPVSAAPKKELPPSSPPRSAAE